MKRILFVDDEAPALEGLRSRLHRHHAPGRVAQSEFDVLAAVCVAHALAPCDDASAFGAPLSADPRVDESYLASVRAPFDWAEATRRVTARINS